MTDLQTDTAATMDFQYRPLPGRGRRLAARFLTGESQRLYLAPDHLMVLQKRVYEVKPKNFYFTDIQAITVQTNNDRIVYGILNGLFMMAFLLFASLFARSGASTFNGGTITMLVLAGLFAAPFLINLALGPTCTVRLHTAVQVEELTALRRLGATRKCLGILTPYIEAAQGQQSGENLLGESMGMHTPLASANEIPQMGERKEKLKVVGRGLHWAAFGLLVAFGLTGVADLFYRSDIKDIFDAVVLLAVFSMLVAAVIRQTNSTIPRQTRVLVWSIFTYNVMLLGILYYAATFAIAFESIDSSGSTNPFVMRQVKSSDLPMWMLQVLAAGSVINIILGAIGLASLQGYRIVEAGTAASPTTDEPPTP